MNARLPAKCHDRICVRACLCGGFIDRPVSSSADGLPPVPAQYYAIHRHGPVAPVTARPRHSGLHADHHRLLPNVRRPWRVLERQVSLAEVLPRSLASFFCFSFFLFSESCNNRWPPSFCFPSYFCSIYFFLNERQCFRVPLESRNVYDIVFRVVELGVALWFPCVLWNCIRWTNISTAISFWPWTDPSVRQPLVKLTRRW